MSRETTKPHPFAFVSDLWRHRDLLWQFSLREVQIRHKGSHLGLLWSVLNPLMMLALYVFVFGFIFNGRFGKLPNESPVDYALGVFLGLSIFQFFAEIITIAPNLIVANPNYVKKVVFPLEILPVSSVSAALFHLLISLSLVLLGISLFGTGLSSGIIWLPIIMLPVALIALGLAWIISALGVFFRDLAQVTQFFTMALMYASAVFYPIEKIQQTSNLLWQVLRLNPLLLALDLARNAVLWGNALNYRHLIYLYIVGAGIFYLGGRSFRLMKPTFADVL